METINITNQKNIEIKTEGKFILDFMNESSFLSVTIYPNLNVTLDIQNLEMQSTLHLNVEENSTCALRGLFENSKKTLDLQAFLQENANLNAYFSDFSIDNTSLNSVTSLKGKNAKANFHVASLCKNKDKKKFKISFEHISEKTFSNIEGYAVSSDEGFITINGVSHIHKDAIKCEAHQKVKGILINETSRAIANPILKIDCDDIIASHACAIGSLNTDHIFYLLSRGLSLEEARRLITVGYLLPIKEYFDDNEKQKIENYVEAGF